MMTELRFIVIHPIDDRPTQYIVTEGAGNPVNRISHTDILNRLCVQTGGSRTFREVKVGQYDPGTELRFLLDTLRKAPDSCYGKPYLNSVFEAVWRALC